jgi:hypothetical protein
MSAPDPAVAPYIQLATFRRSGEEVRTPVWCAPFGAGRLVVYTRDYAWKVKRMRATPRVRLAACNMRGTTALGPWFEGTARELTGPADKQRGLDALAAKYGLSFRIASLLAWLTRGTGQRTVFEIAYGPAQAR